LILLVHPNRARWENYKTTNFNWLYSMINTIFRRKNIN